MNVMTEIAHFAPIIVLLIMGGVFVARISSQSAEGADVSAKRFKPLHAGLVVGLAALIIGLSEAFLGRSGRNVAFWLLPVALAVVFIVVLPQTGSGEAGAIETDRQRKIRVSILALLSLCISVAIILTT